MDDDTPPRLARATAGASALGATALLVLSFGPSALALSPSPQAGTPARAAISAPAPGSGTPEMPRRTADEGESSAR